MTLEGDSPRAHEPAANSAWAAPTETEELTWGAHGHGARGRRRMQQRAGAATAVSRVLPCAAEEQLPLSKVPGFACVHQHHTWGLIPELSMISARDTAPVLSQLVRAQPERVSQGSPGQARSPQTVATEVRVSPSEFFTFLNNYLPWKNYFLVNVFPLNDRSALWTRTI